MSGDRRRHIEISGEVARAQSVPDDLDATQREPYTIPSTRRRRSAAWIYGVGAVGVGVTIAAGLPVRLAVIGVLLAVVAVWHAMSAWRIEVLDPAALDAATRSVDFAVGHASAVVGFDGWRARPVWNVLVFSAEEPPTQRGLVRVDAVTGAVVETYTEDVVEPS